MRFQPFLFLTSLTLAKISKQRRRLQFPEVVAKCFFCVVLEKLRLKLEVEAVGSINTCHRLWRTQVNTS